MMCTALCNCQKNNDETKQNSPDNVAQPTNDGLIITENPWPDTATNGTFDLDSSTITGGDTTGTSSGGDLEG